jgi:Peptidase family M48
MTNAEECPLCGAHVEFNESFVTWCPACEWNLLPFAPEFAVDPALVAAIRCAHDETDRLFQEALSDRAVLFDRRTMRWSRFVCSMFGRFPSFVTLLIMAGSLFLVNPTTKDQAIKFAVKIGLLVAILSGVNFASVTFRQRRRRRYGDMGTTGQLLNRTHLPATFVLIDEICHELKVRSPKTVLLQRWFNAAASSNQLQLGLPMVAALKADEFLALLGHELSHTRRDEHGDLRAAHRAARLTSRFVKPSSAKLQPTSILGRLRAFPSSLMTRLWGAVMAHRLRIHQTLEYRADACAASIAGTEAATSLQTILPLYESADVGARRAILNGEEIWSAIKDRVRSVPAVELARLRRLSVYRPRAPDVSHPPLAYRLELLEKWPVDRPRIELTDVRFAQIASELMAQGSEIELAMYVAAGRSRYR